MLKSLAAFSQLSGRANAQTNLNNIEGCDSLLKKYWNNRKANKVYNL